MRQELFFWGNIGVPRISLLCSIRKARQYVEIFFIPRPSFFANFPAVPQFPDFIFTSRLRISPATLPGRPPANMGKYFLEIIIWERYRIFNLYVVSVRPHSALEGNPSPVHHVQAVLGETTIFLHYLYFPFLLTFLFWLFTWERPVRPAGTIGKRVNSQGT